MRHHYNAVKYDLIYPQQVQLMARHPRTPVLTLFDYRQGAARTSRCSLSAWGRPGRGSLARTADCGTTSRARGAISRADGAPRDGDSRRPIFHRPPAE
ncbi:hypothetical protein C8R44DRAFT_276841 [Mycena epipterygia]|nr:hypothetical protein C8R44DRAFT_276841 [Mycena epipterygia]